MRWQRCPLVFLALHRLACISGAACSHHSSLHGAGFSSRGEVLADVGLTEQNIARRITGWLAALPTPVPEREVSERLDLPSALMSAG